MATDQPPVTDLCAVPAAQSPDGSPPNLVDPVDLTVETIVVGSIFAGLSLVCFVARMLHNFKNLKSADYLTIVGFILSTGYTGVIIGLRKFSRHQWDIPACWFMTGYINKLLFGSNILLGITQFFVKAAILVVYFQIFATSRTMRWVIYAGLIFAGIIYLPHPIIVSIFSVPHAGETWADLSSNGRGEKISFYAPVHGFGSIILDIYILVVPLVIVSKLRISKKKRLQLIMVFAMGVLGIVSSIVSCYYRMSILLDKTDVTWKQAQLFIWIMIEHDVALVVGSMPAVAGFVRTNITQSDMLSHLLSKTFSSITFSRKSSRDESEASLDNHEAKVKATPQGRHSRSNYQEIDDSSLDMRTDVTSLPIQQPPNYSRPHIGDVESGIVRTTEIWQNDTFPATKH